MNISGTLPYIYINFAAPDALHALCSKATNKHCVTSTFKSNVQYYAVLLNLILNMIFKSFALHIIMARLITKCECCGDALTLLAADNCLQHMLD